MIPPLAWTLLIVSLWTSGSSEILQQETIKVLYPKINSTENLECECNSSFDSVYWFRSISKYNRMQYIGKCNNADRDGYGTGVDEARFKISRKSGYLFSLRISDVTEEDTGIYSCVLQGRKINMEIWKPGILLQPGVTPPTLPPKIQKPKPPTKSRCTCSKKKSSQGGCDSPILWSLVGLMATLALALVCTLYYFSQMTAGDVDRRTIKEGQPVDMKCEIKGMGTLIVWFRVLDKSGMEFIASFTNNGYKKDTHNTPSSKFIFTKSSQHIVTLESFSRDKDSGIYSCASLLRGVELKFGPIIQLVGG
ncbi:Cyclin-dependent kinase 18, partial [Nibea albiflora]